MTAPKNPHVRHAIAAADQLADALYTLNKAGRAFSLEVPGSPYGDTKAALLTVLKGIYGTTCGREVYDRHVALGVSPSCAAEGLGVAPIERVEVEA